MHKVRIQPLLSRKDYDEFKRLAPEDPTLPPTFDEWQEINWEQQQVFRKSGVPVENIHIDVEEFKTYCASCGINPDGVARAAYAVQKYCPLKK